MVDSKLVENKNYLITLVQSGYHSCEIPLSVFY